jgi:uncharacterized protein (DUF983 family)
MLVSHRSTSTDSGYNDAMKPTNHASGSTNEPAAESFPAIKPTLGTMLSRAFRLRCPACGEGRLFRKWIQMHPHCQHCGFRFERGPGYWLGSIYVNYGLTALVVTAGYFALFFSELMTPNQILILLTAFCVLFPLWFFRYARAIWVAVDLYLDPAQQTEFAPEESASDEE